MRLANLKGAKALFHIQSVNRVLDARSKAAITNLLIYGFNAPPLAALFSGCEFVLK